MALRAHREDVIIADSARIVLVGTTGGGKSTTGNILLAEDVFEVSDDQTSKTDKVTSWRSREYGWTVVDTPGMGDLPEQPKTMSIAKYKELCKQRRAEFFTDITKELHAHGGLVLFTLQSGRLDELKANHLKALSMVLHDCFTSSVVLLITGVPGKYAVPVTTDTGVLRKKMENYLHYLVTQRTGAEAKAAVKFAAVLGVCDAGFSSDRHPAHPMHLPGAITEMLKARIAYLDPGVAMNWTELVAKAYKSADFLKEQHCANNTTIKALSSLNKRQEFVKKQLRACEAAAAAGATVCAAGAAVWIMPVLAIIGAVVGGTMAAAAGIALVVYNKELDGLDKKRKDLTAQLQRQTDDLKDYEGMTEEGLLNHAANIEELVFGQLR